MQNGEPMAIKTILSTLFFLVTTFCSGQESPVATTPQQAITFFFDGLSELNDNKIRQHVTTDFLLLENGHVWNTDSLINAMGRRKGMDFKRINTFRYIRTEEKARTAILAYHNRADITLNGNPIVVEWLESAQLVKEGNSWKIKLLHSTRLPPEKR